MLGRKNRFHGYNSVSAAYKHSKTVRSNGCSLTYRLNTRRQDYRVAVVVSKKVSKSAVQRNRIRRRIYEVVRQSSIQQPYDLVITVFDQGFATVPLQQLSSTLQTLFDKSGISSR